MRYTCFFTSAVMIILYSAGCGGAKNGAVPDWVRGTPSSPDYIYAVGISGKTFYPTDAITYATDNARRELASMIRTRIISMTETRDSSRNDDISIESIAVTDEDLQGSKVRKRWIDTDGVTGVAPGTTYVLISIKREKFEQLIKKYR